MTRSALTSALVLLTLVALAITPEAVAAPGWRWPVEGEVLTAYRNGDDPYAGGQHRGIDIAAPLRTPVVAAAGGVVTFAGSAGDSGVTVSIRTAGGAFDTSYLHLAGAAVRRGDSVGAGEAIGTVGTTGRRSADVPHLHFGVREAGSRHGYRDPLTLLPPPATPSERPAPPRPVPVTLPEPLTPGPAQLGAAVAAPGPVAAPAPGLGPAPALGAAPGPAPATAPGLGPALGAAPGSAPATAPGLGPAPSPATAPGLGPAPAHAHSAAPSRARPTDSPAATAPNPSQAGAADGRATTRGGTTAAIASHGDAPRASGAADPSARATRPTARGGAAPSAGLDFGWLAACIGLVALAALLARPRGPVAAMRAGRLLTEEGDPSPVRGSA